MTVGQQANLGGSRHRKNMEGMTSRTGVLRVWRKRHGRYNQSRIANEGVHNDGGIGSHPAGEVIRSLNPQRGGELLTGEEPAKGRKEGQGRVESGCL